MQIYKDSKKSVTERVEDLLSRMTLEEKAAQLCGDLPMGLVQDGMPTTELLKKMYPYGHGRITQYSTMGLTDPIKIATLSNILQKYFIEETRLGIPVVLQTENLCGYPGIAGTMFPAQINLSCTWDPELAEIMSGIIAEESKAVGINSAMSPVIDIARDHRWGRVYETYGEDPYLTSQMGIHYVRGMQKNKKDGLSCIAKHFLGYSESQGGLNTAVCRISDRELYEVFATPFEAVMREADVSSVMANYGEIDGMCVVSNRKIAHVLLRETMKFDGILTSDGAGILKTFKDFKTAKSYEEAGLLAKKAGTDTEIPIGNAFRKLPDFVRAGKLDESTLDDSVRRVLKVKFEYGLFDDPYIDLDKVTKSLNNDRKNTLSEEIAAKSLVLLKNEGILPIKKGTRLAVVGPHGDSLRYPVSGYTYPAYVEMLTAETPENKASIGGLADEAQDDSKKAFDNPFQAFTKGLSYQEKKAIGDIDSLLRNMGARTLKEELADRFPVIYEKGCDITNDDTSGFSAAVKAAKASDVVIMACGGNSGWVDVTGGEGKDRCSFELPGVQKELLELLCATGKPVVLILYGPGIFALPWACDHIGSIIQAWLPGQYAAKSLADALEGVRNFGGKLTTTIPRSVGQTPVTYNHRTGSGYASQTAPMESLIFTGGYVDQSNHPLFCFGYGLSYTSFKLSDFKTESKEVSTDGTIVISCTIMNTGKRQGDEVVQLYYRTKNVHVVRPVKQLAGFQRVSLKAQERKHLTFKLKTSQLGYYNENMEFVVEPAALDIMVGTSAHQIAYTEEIMLTGEKIDLMGRRSYTCEVITTEALA